jgi:hypothetical protein
MPRIFLSYRRQDAEYVAELIRDRIAETFGPESVFMDVDSIPVGVDFREQIADALRDCDLFVAVISPNWSGRGEGDGPRRIDQPGDFVRIEIESAFARKIPIVPVLVANAPPLQARDVPDSVRDLLFLQAAQVRPGRDSRTDLEALIKGLQDRLAAAGRLRTPRTEPAKSAAEPEKEHAPSRPPAPAGWLSQHKGIVLAGVVVLALAVATPVVLNWLSGRGERLPQPTGQALPQAPAPAPPPRSGNNSPAGSPDTAGPPTEPRQPPPAAPLKGDLRGYRIDVFWCDQSGAPAQLQANQITASLRTAFELAGIRLRKLERERNGPWASGYEIRVDADGSEDDAGKLVQQHLAAHFPRRPFGGWTSPSPSARYISVFVCPGADSNEELDRRQRRF